MTSKIKINVSALFSDFIERTHFHLALSTLIQLMTPYLDMLLEEPQGIEENLIQLQF